MNQRSKLHLLFWIVCIIMLTIVYGAGMPGYGMAIQAVLMMVPIDMAYFYTINFLLLPTFLYRKKYLPLAVALVVCAFCFALLYRIMEIKVVDPYIYSLIRAKQGPFVWSKLQGTFREQLFKPNYFIAALEQTNIVIWVCLALKFFKMWYMKRQAATQAELDFLKAQIHPHFLFNTLNNLYALTLNQSPESPAIVLGLSNILRYMLYECNTDTVTLKKDVEILESYIALEKIRYEGRLDLSFYSSGEMANQQIPPLLMLPLVENAFKHGISETLHDAWINISLAVSPTLLKFKVSNSKPICLATAKEKNYGKIGLSNVRKRLEILYPEAHQLKIYEEEEMYLAILEIHFINN